MVDAEREQNTLMIQAYREALDTPRIAQARKALFEQASIEPAKHIAGFIGPGQQDDKPQGRPGFVVEDRTDNSSD
jgi:hypothetical protein